MGDILIKMLGCTLYVILHYTIRTLFHTQVSQSQREEDFQIEVQVAQPQQEVQVEVQVQVSVSPAALNNIFFMHYLSNIQYHLSLKLFLSFLSRSRSRSKSKGKRSPSRGDSKDRDAKKVNDTEKKIGYFIPNSAQSKSGSKSRSGSPTKENGDSRRSRSRSTFSLHTFPNFHLHHYDCNYPTGPTFSKLFQYILSLTFSSITMILTIPQVHLQEWGRLPPQEWRRFWGRLSKKEHILKYSRAFFLFSHANCSQKNPCDQLVHTTTQRVIHLSSIKNCLSGQ